MSTVISILNYKKQVEQPILILAGLHQSDLPVSSEMKEILANCATALAAARSAHIQVAFVRRMLPAPSISEPPPYPAWIKGFEPTRDDMVFDVLQPSCYSNMEFARTIDYSNGNFAIAGLFAESTCLSTAVEAHHRHHNFVYLFDASGSQNHGMVPLLQFHAAVTQMISGYGPVMKAAEWSLAVSSNRIRKVTKQKDFADS